MPLEDGRLGADTLIGGLGNDSYVVDNINDVLVENANEGTDTVQSKIDYVLGANFENLTLLGIAAVYGTGNAGARDPAYETANPAIAGVWATGDITVDGAVKAYGNPNLAKKQALSARALTDLDRWIADHLRVAAAA